MAEEVKGMVLPPPAQVGVVVRDLEKAIDLLLQNVRAGSIPDCGLCSRTTLGSGETVSDQAENRHVCMGTGPVGAH